MQTPRIYGLWVALWIAATIPGTTSAADTGETDPVEPNSVDLAPLLSNYRFWRADERTRLPKYLREISGLAVIEPGVVALHHDNSALVWSFDYRSSQLSAAPLITQAGRPDGRKGDYEGIATLGHRLLLTTSHADLLLLQPSTGSQAAGEPKTLATNFRRHCNFEGLALADADKAQPIALLPCKYPRFEEYGRAAAEDHLVYLFRHLLGQASDATTGSLGPLTIDVTPVLRQTGKKRLRPSAVEVVGDRLLVLAGKERVLLETTATGKLIAWRRLFWPRHRQAEGLTMDANGSLIIADEGRWLGGTITVYQPKNGYQPRTATTSK